MTSNHISVGNNMMIAIMKIFVEDRCYLLILKQWSYRYRAQHTCHLDDVMYMAHLR